MEFGTCLVDRKQKRELSALDILKLDLIADRPASKDLLVSYYILARISSTEPQQIVKSKSVFSIEANECILSTSELGKYLHLDKMKALRVLQSLENIGAVVVKKLEKQKGLRISLM